MTLSHKHAAARRKELDSRAAKRRGLVPYGFRLPAGFTPTPIFASVRTRLRAFAHGGWRHQSAYANHPAYRAPQGAMQKWVSGFTLIELLVVAAIITVVTGIVLVNQNSFNRTLILANAAYDVALTLRSAETYGLGSRGTGASANAGYGLEFSTGAPAEFTFFVDTVPVPGGAGACHPLPPNGASAPNALPGNCRYDGAGSGEHIQTYKLNNRVSISRFCAYTSLTSYCTALGARAIDTLDVVFARPNPTPTFSVSAGGFALATGGGSASLYKACVTLATPLGDARSITAWWNGAVFTAPGACP